MCQFHALIGGIDALACGGIGASMTRYGMTALIFRTANLRAHDFTRCWYKSVPEHITPESREAAPSEGGDEGRVEKDSTSAPPCKAVSYASPSMHATHHGISQREEGQIGVLLFEIPQPPLEVEQAVVQAGLPKRASFASVRAVESSTPVTSLVVSEEGDSAICAHAVRPFVAPYVF